jgi:hypothetical protein
LAYCQIAVYLTNDIDSKILHFKEPARHGHCSQKDKDTFSKIIVAPSYPTLPIIVVFKEYNKPENNGEGKGEYENKDNEKW